MFIRKLFEINRKINFFLTDCSVTYLIFLISIRIETLRKDDRENLKKKNCVCRYEEKNFRKYLTILWSIKLVFLNIFIFKKMAPEI